MNNHKEEFLKKAGAAYDKVNKAHMKSDGDLYDLEENIFETFKDIQSELMSEIQKDKNSTLQKKMPDL